MANKHMREYDSWTIVCLICQQDLAPDGIRPPYSVQRDHLLTHGVEFRLCLPTKNGYNVDELRNADGTWEDVSSSIYAEEAGHGRQVLMAIRTFGETLASEQSD